MKLLDKIDNPNDIKNFNIEELKILSGEIRNEIIEVVSKNGGHLGASLGVVELTIALHYVFTAPEDIIIWDVGHQAYPHKLITGRRQLLKDIRKPGGISGFTKRDESIYDPFGAGHSSTSVSAALGFAVARELNGQNNHVISIIGDGAMSAGMAYEALNNASGTATKMITILNDNKMSIAPAVGAMSRYLTKLISSRKYQKAKNIAHDALHYAPALVEKTIKVIKNYTKEITASNNNNFFQELGMHYLGPIDGHDLTILVEVLQNIRDNNEILKPTLLHVLTEKGKGFGSPEKSTESYHAVLPFDLNTKIQRKSSANFLTYTKVFARTLEKILSADKEVIAITAAMPSGTGLDLLMNQFPDRVYDVGIAEQHAVTFAAGLAASGIIKPFVAIYSTFLQRAYDQIVHDVAIQSLPVRFMIDRAGLVGQDGPTHAGSFDIAYLANLPNFICMAPSNVMDLADMILTAYEINDRPSSIRYPKRDTDIIEFNHKPKKIQIGKGEIVKQGKEIAILSLGTRLNEALLASKRLSDEGHDITVADAMFIKPLDKELIIKLANSHRILITVEEGVIGGFGSHVAQLLLNSGILEKGLKFRALFLPDRFIEHNDVNQMYEEAGLNSSGIYNVIKGLL